MKQIKIKIENIKFETSLNPSAFDARVNIDGLIQHRIPNNIEMISKLKKLKGIFLLLKS